jgi:hypothetical protein
MVRIVRENSKKTLQIEKRSGLLGQAAFSDNIITLNDISNDRRTEEAEQFSP